MPKPKTPRIEIDDFDDDSWQVLVGVFLVLKGEKFLLDSVDAEDVSRIEWEKFVSKSKGRAKQLGVPFVNKAQSPDFN